MNIFFFKIVFILTRFTSVLIFGSIGTFVDEIWEGGGEKNTKIDPLPTPNGLESSK